MLFWLSILPSEVATGLMAAYINGVGCTERGHMNDRVPSVLRGESDTQHVECLSELPLGFAGGKKSCLPKGRHALS